MINLISGLMNSGKTLYMTHKLYKAYKKGKTIITNYNLYFPKSKFNNKIFKINRDTLSIWAINGESLKNVCIGLDEFWLWADSRQAMQNTTISYFFNQSSKDDMEIYLTAQHSGQFDSRLRNNCHKVTECSRVIYENNKFYAINEEQRFLPKELLNKLYIKAIEFKKISRNFLSNIEISGTFYIKAIPYFILYDTKEKIGIKK